MKVKITILFILITLAAYFIYTKPDGRLHITMCDVGQGDAILIKTPLNKKHIIDGGPDNKILNCLGRKTPLYDRSIESISISHLHSDHTTGIIETIKRYGTNNIVTNTIKQNTPEVKELFSQIEAKQIKVQSAYTGESIFAEPDIATHIFYPSKDSWNTENGEWQAYLYDFNDSSTVFSLHYGKLMMLFTGDAGEKVLDTIAESTEFKNYTRQSYARVLKSPHHGSKDGLALKMLDIYQPQVALISLGQDNNFGHPHKEVLDEYSRRKIQIIRTDLNGDIEIISNGNKVWFDLEKMPQQ